MTMVEPLRVACIGMGWWSDVLADAIKRSSKLKIVACFTRSEQKRAAFAAMRSSFALLKAGWGGNAPFESWFEDDLNNAHLASVATYFTCVPGFEHELKAVGGDLTAFYTRVRALAKLDQEKRDAIVCGSNP